MKEASASSRRVSAYFILPAPISCCIFLPCLMRVRCLRYFPLRLCVIESCRYKSEQVAALPGCNENKYSKCVPRCFSSACGGKCQQPSGYVHVDAAGSAGHVLAVCVRVAQILDRQSHLTKLSAQSAPLANASSNNPSASWYKAALSLRSQSSLIIAMVILAS
jgi:hypothetical protein